MQSVPPPRLTRQQYSRLLGATDFWRPYAEVALRSSGLPKQHLVSGFPGTYPTLVGDQLVVKLFGHFGDWRHRHRVETVVTSAIGADDRIRAPRLIATGELYPGRTENWPYLVTERMDGTAWRDAGLDSADRLTVAGRLGDQLRLVHELPATDSGLPDDDWLHRHRAGAADRHRDWKSLPEHLVAQLDDYLADLPRRRPRLVHGDVTEDHVFVRDGRLIGLIDWADAMITDPLYELAAVHLETFAGDRELLTAFLNGYGWEPEPEFARQAMQVALLHEFNVLDHWRGVAASADTLDDLAQWIWQPV